jgi:peroxiredoxin
LIQDYLVDSSKDWETLDRYLSLIEGDAVTNKLYGKLKAVIENYRRTAIGNKAPDFSLISTKRDTLSLETFKDKYLVLTFDSPEYVKGKRDYTALTEIKKKFPKEKVEILTVSLEENPTKWDSIARHEKIDWYQVIDSRGLASEVYLAYNIRELPGHILLDKEGLIVARDISTDSIKTVLNDLINKKQ